VRPTQKRPRCSWSWAAPVASLGLAVCAAAAEPADSTATKRLVATVTVYNQDLGLVRELRQVDLAAGSTALRYMDVAAQVRPETVSVKVARGEPVRVLEQNYEYDLLSPRKILEKYVGRDLTVHVKNDQTGEERPVAARLLSVNDGEVFQIGNEISLGLPGRVVVPELPGTLIARPTLVWQLETKSAGPRELDVSYLTGGMSWKADYVAVLEPSEKSIDLTAWVTVDNHSGASFENARLKLIAGDVRVVSAPPVRLRREMAMMAADAESFTERPFFEYHLYALERPTTLKDNQSKQIELLHAAEVPVSKRYVAESTFDPYGTPSNPDAPPAKAEVKLEFDNTPTARLGRPLPKGTVRVYKRDTDGALTFAGEDSIDHTPERQTVRLLLGQAFDVTWQRSVTGFREVSKREVQGDVEIKLANRRKENVIVTVIERFSGERDLLNSSLPAREPNAFTLEFDVAVAAGGEATLTYQVLARRPGP
jgi:hypothetical protein